MELRVRHTATVPYFGWAFDGPIRQAVVVRLRSGAKAVEAVARGRSAPPEPKRPWWAPPVAMSGDQIRVIATLSLLLAFAQYGGALLTQTINFVAETYDATNAQLGVLTAVVRVGTVIAVVGGALADRIGRRRLVIWSVGLSLAATALTALAPDLFTFGVLQTVVRGATTLAFGIAVIAAVEDAPEAARTYTIAIVGIASGLGFVLGVVLLPIADLAIDAWRTLFALGLVGLLFLPRISRTLTESTRFESLARRTAERGRLREVVDRRYGGRFALMCAVGFLLNVFFAPQSQFMNRYLGAERGFSGFGILVLRAVTQSIPAFAAAYIGGRLAESAGRRNTARIGLIVGAAMTALFFLTGGPLLWIGLAVSTAGLAASGPAISAFGTELFPTEVRGTAGAGLTIAGVTGSAVGLVTVGFLAEGPLGSVGKAVAVTAISPVIVALLLIRRLPEARGQLLDDLSPSEV
jgi:MFS family permease